MIMGCSIPPHGCLFVDAALHSARDRIALSRQTPEGGIVYRQPMLASYVKFRVRRQLLTPERPRAAAGDSQAAPEAEEENRQPWLLYLCVLRRAAWCG